MPLPQAHSAQACEEKEFLVSHTSFDKPRESYDSGFGDSTSPGVLRRSSYISSTFILTLLQYIPQSVKHLRSSFRNLRSARPSTVAANHSRASGLYLFSLIRSALVFLLPSFLHHLLLPGGEVKASKIHATSWLDGIRGFAALFVFFYHFSQRIWGSNDYGWGVHVNGTEYTGFLRLPVLRILYAGPAAVSVFFVVSGFALSIKPVSQMLKRDTAGLLATISSATLRRPLRLFLPCLAATFMDFIAVRTGLFAATRWVAQNPEILTGVKPPHIGLRGPFWTQFWDWLWEGLRMVNIFRWDMDRYGVFEDDYDKHLWTIPIEFRCSLILFLTQAALANLSSFYRISIQTMLCALAQYAGRWDMLLFWGGGVLCELYTLWNKQPARQNAIQLPLSSAASEKPASARAQHGRFRSIAITVAFLTSLHLICYPRLMGPKTPGYRFISSLLPENTSEWTTYHIFQGLGALLLISTVACSPKLTAFFSGSLPRYLGRISFALYLVHGCLNHTLGYALLGWTYGVFGKKDGWPLAARFGTALIIELTSVIWIADLFERTVGTATVSLGRIIENAMTEKKQ